MPELHDALAAEAERRRPTQHPAFSTLVERRRRRDLSITGAAGTALAALAVMGVALVPDPVGQRGPETMGPADTLSPDLRDLLEQCIGREPHITETDTFVGLSEAQLAELRGGPPRRVVGRDGECLDRTDELRPGRLNLILEDGAVVWSGVEVGQQMENVQFPVELDEERVVAPADVEALERCASLPGARLEPVRQPAPSDVRIVSVTGAVDDVGRVQQCLEALPGVTVSEPQENPAPPRSPQEDAELAAFVEMCVGNDTDVVETNTYVGLTEDELHLKRGPARDVLVVGRDGECLGEDRSLVDGRIDLVVDDGGIVWDGVERLR